jgi:hypothetical protein
VVRVGVTGHRILPPEVTPGIRETVDDILKKIKGITDEIHSRGREFYQGVHLRAISPIAEGADRIFAEEALELGYELQCPLPLPQSDYEQDFKKEDSPPGSLQKFRELISNKKVFSLDGTGDKEDDRNKAYLAVGHLLIRQSDIIVAIWNGEPEKGLGGTGEIVRLAREQEMPILWLNPKSPKRVVLLREDPRSQELDGDSQWEASLRARLERALLPGTQEGAQKVVHRKCHVEASLLQQESSRFTDRLCSHLLRFAPSPKKRDETKAALRYLAEPLPKRWNAAEEAPEPQKQEDALLKSGFEWADNVANKYAQSYRRSFRWSYILGAFAVLLAFLGTVIDHDAPGILRHASRLLLAAELATLISIAYIVARGRIRHLHERWLDSRHLAESLRMMRVLALFGRVPENLHIPAHLQESDPRKTWFHWYFRALIRDAGMSSLRLDKPTLLLLQDWLLKSLQGQIDYQARRACRSRCGLIIGKFLAYTFFSSALVACAFHIFLHEKGILLIMLNMIVIVLPAFAGATEAIIHHSELERIERHSHALGETLAEILSRYGTPEIVTSQGLIGLAETFSKACFEEVRDWRFLLNDLPPLTPT